jgi:hypothetical protein
MTNSATTHHGEQDESVKPIYKRRGLATCGPSVVTSNRVVDNRLVIPYNPYLTQRCNAHINVECRISVAACKYLFKYVHNVRLGIDGIVDTFHTHFAVILGVIRIRSLLNHHEIRRHSSKDIIDPSSYYKGGDR